MSRDLLNSLRERGFQVVALSGGRLKVFPSDRLADIDRDAIRSNKAGLLSELSAEYVEPWNDAEIEAYTRRTLFLIAMGCAEPSAEAVAERLHERDRDGTDLRLCWECQGLRRNVCTRWQAAGYTRPETPLTNVLQRCPGFQLASQLASLEREAS